MRGDLAALLGRQTLRQWRHHRALAAPIGIRDELALERSLRLRRKAGVADLGAPFPVHAVASRAEEHNLEH